VELEYTRQRDARVDAEQLDRREFHLIARNEVEAAQVEARAARQKYDHRVSCETS
jgi:hypothetical protein